jgi:rod shape-determining protein MreD
MWKKIILIVCFSLIAIFVQVVFGPWLEIGGIRPDFVLLVVVIIGQLKGRMVGQIYGFLIGLLIDAIGMGSFLGLSALSKTTAGFLSGFLKDKKTRLNPIVFYSTIIGIIFLHFTIFYLINFNSSEIGLQNILGKHVIPTALYTGILYLIIDYILPITLK